MLNRIFLDTNVYIVGVADTESIEWEILTWLGFDGSQSARAEVIVSAELIEQILRVAKRLKSKDWAGSIVSRMWQNLKLRYVLVDTQESSKLASLGWLPREDIGIYLAAKQGRADCFISSNRELVRAVVTETKDFECFTPKNFVNRYLN
ncbi:hypothetical protein [cf. Phormidesmis sp. LEGE 11477]|uniref:hypothetical protein n=1 Tax=cf. Phormidesmis sp. LEGE 11477 TaxID=1828680 RepID=UPI00187FEAEC|nr:hypothetical protein [cf. Phormidesmis sp. LEGE 11477]MBE9059559.1 hypothetical protein [cf. Phormidesmis sp. LEGE 11477]